MCGRFTVAVPREDLFDEFGLTEAPFDIHPRYNVAPTQIAPVLLRGDEGALRLAGFRWGLVPFWAAGPDVGQRMINARAETMAEKPAFSAAFRERRWGPRKDPLRTFTIVTTAAAPSVRHIHDRMPLVLGPAARDRWLDPAAEPGELLELARPYPGDDLEAWAVSKLVNSPANDAPDCVCPVDATAAGDGPAPPPLQHTLF
jgi:putative SOS response-associated peptidase YedK